MTKSEHLNNIKTLKTFQKYCKTNGELLCIQKVYEGKRILSILDLKEGQIIEMDTRQYLLACTLASEKNIHFPDFFNPKDCEYLLNNEIYSKCPDRILGEFYYSKKLDPINDEINKIQEEIFELEIKKQKLEVNQAKLIKNFLSETNDEEK